MRDPVDPSSGPFAALGRFVTARRGWILAFWAVVVLFFGYEATQAALKHGIGGVPDSDSRRVEQVLTTRFHHPYFPTALVTVHGPGRVDDADFKATLDDLTKTLKASGLVRGVHTRLDGAPLLPASPDGRTTYALIGLQASGMDDAEKLVPDVRAAVEPVRARHKAYDLTLTSEAAINHDVELAAAAGASGAERHALPFALVVLLLAFGAPLAAGLPLVIGVSATVITTGLIALISQWFSLSAVALNVASMIGLGVGIDYALLMVMRLVAERKRGLAPLEAASAILPTAGRAVAASGATVAIGLAALMLTGLSEVDAIGLGGLIVVSLAVAAALTLLPALLAVLGTKLEILQLPFRLGEHDVAWRWWAGRITKRPWLGLVAAFVLLSPFLWPIPRLTGGYPPAKFFPSGLESSRGTHALEQVGDSGWLAPLLIVVTLPGEHGKDGAAFAPKTVLALHRLTTRLKKLPGVFDVRGLTALTDDMSALTALQLYARPARTLAKHPEVAQLFLSDDRSQTLITAMPRNASGFQERLAVAREVRRKLKEVVPGLEGATYMVGGPAATGVDVEDRITDRFPPIVGLVGVLTYFTLLFTFRSWLLPLAAILINTLPVLAGYGALVLVFQEGWGASLLSLPGPVGVTPIMVPLVLFCLVFGLSMDYAVFMLARIQEEYLATDDNDAAIATGLASTAPIVTSAALVMAIVFGAFSLTSVLPVKMIGFGLAVSVVVDATVVRLLLVPSVLALLGRWSWIGPGNPRGNSA